MLLLLTFYVEAAALVGGFLSCSPRFEFITCGGFNLDNKRCNGDFLLQDATTRLDCQFEYA
jgi:hypothetical protein